MLTFYPFGNINTRGSFRNRFVRMFRVSEEKSWRHFFSRKRNISIVVFPENQYHDRDDIAFGGKQILRDGWRYLFSRKTNITIVTIFVFPENKYYGTDVIVRKYLWFRSESICFDVSLPGRKIVKTVLFPEKKYFDRWRCPFFPENKYHDRDDILTMFAFPEYKYRDLDDIRVPGEQILRNRREKLISEHLFLL